MRAASILPLAITAAALAGCAAESPRTSNQGTASVGTAGSGLPQRDLTLQTPERPALDVASPVELSRAAPEPKLARRARHSPKPAPVPAPMTVAAPAALAAVPVPAVAVVQVRAETAREEEEEDAVGVGRELAARKDGHRHSGVERPVVVPGRHSWDPGGPGRGMIIEGGGGGGGGRCRPRGGVRGIGIAGRIPVGVPGRRLR